MSNHPNRSNQYIIIDDLGRVAGRVTARLSRAQKNQKHEYGWRDERGILHVEGIGRARTITQVFGGPGADKHGRTREDYLAELRELSL